MVLRRGGVAAVIGSVLAVAGPARGQSLRGVGELQYQSVERVGSGISRETWVKSFQTDYSRRLPGAIELAARLRFTEQTVARQPDRLRAPEGSVRFAHRNFGFSTAFSPSTIRDARGLVRSQQNLTLTGYAQKQGLPTLAGSWIRSHVDSTERTRESATVSRSLSSTYARSGLAVHGGYGDRLVERALDLGSRTVDRHYNLGTVSQFQAWRAPVSLQYDFTESWANPSGTRSQRARAHTAGGATGFPITSRAGTSMSYSYRRSVVVGVAGTLVQEHNGTLSLSYLLLPAVSLGTSGGVRNAQFGGRTVTETFASAGVAASGQARPGWTVSASAGRTYGWLPGTAVRISDQLGASTAMRLASGLDARANIGLGTTRRPEATTDSLAPRRETGLEFGAGITATPLRRLHLDLSAQRSRSGGSTLGESPIATSYAASARLAVSQRMQTAGAWSQTRAFGGRGSTVQTTVVWNASSRFQVSGGYNRATQTARLAAPSGTTRQESVTGSVTASLGRAMSASVRYGESNRGQSTNLRQWNVNVARRFGR